MKIKRIISLLFIAALPSSCVNGNSSTTFDYYNTNSHEHSGTDITTGSNDSGNTGGTNTDSGSSETSTGSSADSSSDSTDTDTNTSTNTSSSTENGEQIETTADAVAKANLMTLEELENASKKEWEEKPDGVFTALTLSLASRKVMEEMANKYEWLNYTNSNDSHSSIIEGDNCYVKSDYKDYILIYVAELAKTQYVADFIIPNNCFSFAKQFEEGTFLSYIPSDAESLGLQYVDNEPLRGGLFNRIFWTNTNYERAGGKPIKNVWQFAGTSADPQHIDQVSFQSPQGEAINLSFLLSVLSPANEARLKKAYQIYYGRNWEQTSKYDTIGQQWVEEFINNITIINTSGSSLMSTIQINKEWDDANVYFGDLYRMRYAAKNNFTVDLDGDGIVGEKDIDLTLSCGGKDYHYTSEVDVNAMTTVKWDYEIEGFNGYIRYEFPLVLKNSLYPYTSCLYIRSMLDPEMFIKATETTAIDTPNGDRAYYGYYYPGTDAPNFPYSKDDWTKENHLEKNIVEDCSFLMNVDQSTIDNIHNLIKAKSD